MFTLKSMRARVDRLEQVARQMAADLEQVKDAERSVLLPTERRQYVNYLTDVIAGVEAAQAVMRKAVRRVEQSGLNEEADDAA